MMLFLVIILCCSSACYQPNRNVRSMLGLDNDIYLSISHRNKRMNETIIYILQFTLLTIYRIKNDM